MNFVISIINPAGLSTMTDICDKLNIPVSLVMYGHGTASRSMLEVLGIDSRERRVVMTVASKEKTAALIRAERERMYIDVPGNGVVISVPIKSVGGGKVMTYLSSGEPVKGKPEFDFDSELIVAIANEGCTDMVMDAAREAGATGGTVLHGKGTLADDAEKFFNVSIAREKELLLIVAHKTQKAEIMKSIIKRAGPDTAAGTIVFSLPVSELAGFRPKGMEE